MAQRGEVTVDECSMASTYSFSFNVIGILIYLSVINRVVAGMQC